MEVVLKPEERMVRGLSVLKSIVASTLGPGGQNVLIELKNGHPLLTKDGVTVARHVTDDTDPLARASMRAVIAAAAQMNAQIGDGTTTAVILTAQLGELLLGKVQKHRRRAVLRHIENLLKLSVEAILEITDEIPCTYEALHSVATLSCNNRPELAGPVAEAVSKVGPDGVVTFQAGGGDTTAEVVGGMHFPRGYVSPYFVTQKERMVFDVENCLVFITEHTLSQTNQVIGLLDYMIRNGQDKGLLIVAPEIADDALTTLVVNKERKGIKVCAVRAPNFGHRRRETLEDIALATGGELVTETKFPNLKEVVGSELAQCFGKARQVLVSREQTVIADGEGSAEAMKVRVDRIREEYQDLSECQEKTHLGERLARLAGGVGMINVGGWDDVEVGANKYLVEDGIHACFAALRSGVIPAGGVGFKAAIRKIQDLPAAESTDEQMAREVFLEVLEEPLIRLISNGESSGEKNSRVMEILSHVVGARESVGYNVLTQEYEDFRETGLVEPASLVKTALEVCFGCASTLGQTLAAIVSTPEENEAARKAGR